MKKGKEPSSDEAFVLRVDRQRLNQECFQDIDLRRDRDGKCKLYHYQGRILWLDSASYDIFLKGVKAHAGVYTRRVYETLLAGLEHAANQLEAVAIPAVAEKREKRERLEQQIDSVITFELSYFEKRTDERLKHKIPLLLLINDEVIPAETRDISPSGLQVRGEPTLDVHPEERIRVKIAPVAARGKRNLPEAVYRVVRVESFPVEKRLALACEEQGSNETVDCLLDIAAAQGRSGTHQQLDSEDVVLTTQALLAERFYMHSTSIIPFFIFQGKTSPNALMIVLSNANNLSLLSQFESTPEKYEFSGLVKHNWIRELKKQIQRDNRAPIIFAVNRGPGDSSPKLRINIECASDTEWYAYVAEHRDQPGFKLIKVFGRELYRPGAAKTDFDLGVLHTDHPRHAEKLLYQMKNMSLAGALVDITEQVKECDLSVYRPVVEASTVVEEIPGGEAIDKQPLTEIWPVRYFEEQRREPRYIGEIRLEIKTTIDDQVYTGSTRDFSLHGLNVTLETPVAARLQNSTVLISFPDIDAHSGWLDRMKAVYKDVPYQVVTIEKGDITHLRLKRLPQGQNDRFTTDFSGHIEKRRYKLRTERSHQVKAAAFRLYSSVFIENSPTIPVFVSNREDADQIGMKVGVTRSPSPLMDFFEVADGEFDFNQFIFHDRMERLLSTVRKKGRGEIFLSLYKKRVENEARYRIQPIPESMLQSGEFLSRAGSMDFRFLKLVLCKARIPDDQEYEQVHGRIGRISQSKLKHLKSEFEGLDAIGDIADITSQYMRFCLLPRYRAE